MDASDYELVRLRNGALTLRSRSYGETLHPGVGPQMEGESLYARQLRIMERLVVSFDPFVVWDIGLGAAANAVSIFNATKTAAGALHLVSFDNTTGPLQFALEHSRELSYLQGYEAVIANVLTHGEARFDNGACSVEWETRIADFPALLRERNVVPKPHAILFDPFSPAANPEMWTAALFADLFRNLDLDRPCNLATYSRSTMVRVSLLVAGFFVGAGLATGNKEETTIAANRLDLLEAPLGLQWLDRAKRSGSAEPLWTPEYRRAPLTASTWERLQAHNQFNK